MTATFLRESVRHIFIGPDHILFVLALVLLGGRLWSQIKIIVEIGQVAIVLPAAPLLIALRGSVPPCVAQGPLTAAACPVVLTGAVRLRQRALVA